MANNVFVYGTLKNKKVLNRLLGRSVPVIKDKLEGYEKVTYETKEGPNYQSIIYKHDSLVEGHLFEVSADELDKIEKWEDEYSKVLLYTKSGKLAYVFVLKHEYITKGYKK